MNQNIQEPNFIQRLRPLHRWVIGLSIGLIIFFLMPHDVPLLLRLLLGWAGFAGFYLFATWQIIYGCSLDFLKKHAVQEDGSRMFASAMILVSSFASIFAVLALVVSKNVQSPFHRYSLIVAVVGMLLSWLLVHTIYIFHYAHMYYRTRGKYRGLDFPGDEEPDYMDFAYFSFCMGCTFQVSDVSVTTKTMRKITFFHSLISFALNTFVVALTINIVAGLSG